MNKPKRTRNAHQHDQLRTMHEAEWQPRLVFRYFRALFNMLRSRAFLVLALSIARKFPSFYYKLGQSEESQCTLCVLINKSLTTLLAETFYKAYCRHCMVAQSDYLFITQISVRKQMFEKCL